ncbi:hypothetical protein [Acetomicrobium sp.]
MPDKDLNAGLKEGLEELAGDSEVGRQKSSPGFLQGERYRGAY